jgi:hypothetical protein
MYVGSLRTVASTTDKLEVQALEVVEDLLLLRLRESRFVEGVRGTRVPASIGNTWRLSDRAGVVLESQQVSSGGGPFTGQVDIAFLAPPTFDARSELTLSCGPISISFTPGGHDSPQ